METSRFELSLPADASEEEAAAIVAALEAYLAVEQQKDAPSWTDRRWWFSGRVAGFENRGVRVPMNAPTDPWRAAGRTDRMR